MLGLAIALGLGSRRFAAHVPEFVADHAGDALWASAVFLALGLALPRASTWAVAGLALAVCLAVELSQLYHAPWIDAVRATPPGGLLLGQGFLWIDLARYVAGVALAASVDRAIVAASARGRTIEP
jgi:hypothetical protein